jgi:Na+-transporting methylmalonyl-CoA/oxaloacetate decarboxylase gamma subunit
MTGTLHRVGLHLLLLALLATLIAWTGTLAQQNLQKSEPAKAETVKKKAAPANAEDAKKKAAPTKAKDAKKKAAAVKAEAARKAPQAQAVIVQNQWTDENFDQWVFQQDRNASGARRRLEGLLTLHIESIDRECKLTEAQKRKLQLAGRGDLKRFFDEYEAVKRLFQSIRDDENQVNQIWQAINPLQMAKMAGLFHEDSLFYKSLQNTLTSEQFSRYDAVARERRQFRHRANIEQAVAILEQSMPLRDEQRRQLITVLMDQIKPSRKSGPGEYYAIMYQLSWIAESKLKPLFDEMQWKVINRQKSQFRGYRQFLKQNDLLPDDDGETDTADAKPVPVKK